MVKKKKEKENNIKQAEKRVYDCKYRYNITSLMKIGKKNSWHNIKAPTTRRRS